MKFFAKTCLLAFLLSLDSSAQAKEPELISEEREGHLVAKYGDQVLAAWQVEPLKKPKGGEVFASSAFLHPITTPSGFECTSIQPDDHLHHFGLWWTWKFIEVDGKKSNTWEVQQRQGAHRAVGARVLASEPGSVSWELKNQVVTGKIGHEEPRIDETTILTTRVVGDATVLDIAISQTVVDQAVKIVDYRYSGFTWRGPQSWNKDNSTLITSEGKARDVANGTAANWMMVRGKTAQGHATFLMMSAAEKLAGIQEKLRVWGPEDHKGTPFINFNPVMKKALSLDEAHPAVSKRNYRIIAADRSIEPEEAQREWEAWVAEL